MALSRRLAALPVRQRCARAGAAVVAYGHRQPPALLGEYTPVIPPKRHTRVGPTPTALKILAVGGVRPPPLEQPQLPRIAFATFLRHVGAWLGALGRAMVRPAIKTPPRRAADP